MDLKDFDISDIFGKSDIFDKLDDFIDKIKDDSDFKKDFSKDPVKALESVLGVNLPDEKINDIVKFVKTKISTDKIEDFFEDLFEK